MNITTMVEAVQFEADSSSGRPSIILRLSPEALDATVVGDVQALVDLNVRAVEGDGG